MISTKEFVKVGRFVMLSNSESGTKMDLLIDKPGKVIQILDNRVIVKTVKGTEISVDIESLKTVPVYRDLHVGEFVNVITNQEQAKCLQKDHGGWTELLTVFLGSKVEILRFGQGNTALVRYMGMEFVMNQLCLVPLDIFHEHQSVITKSDKHLQILAINDMLVLSVPNLVPIETVLSEIVIYEYFTSEIQNSLQLLLAACKDKDTEKIRQFANSNVVNAADVRTGIYPLKYAMQTQNRDLFRLLIECGASVVTKYENGRSILHESALGGSPPELVLDFVTDSDSDSGALFACDWTDCTPLMVAAECGNCEFVRQVFARQGTQLQCRDKFGNTALHCAAAYNQLDMTQLLLELVSDQHRDQLLLTENEDGFSPFLLAVGKSHFEVAEAMLEGNRSLLGSCRTGSGVSWLHMVVLHNPTKLRPLLTSERWGLGSSVNTCDQWGETPLHLACVVGPNWAQEATDNVRLLCEYGAAVDAAGTSGNTPLHKTVKGITDNKIAFVGSIIRVLLEFGANIRLTNAKGERPVDIVRKRRIKDADLFKLLDPGLDKENQNNETEEPNFDSIEDPNSMKMLQEKIEEIRAKNSCKVCLTSEAQVAFNCGHMTCSACSKKISQCPFCRQEITARIQLQQT